MAVEPDAWAWVPECARLAAARVGLGQPANGEPCRRRGSILGSTWIGEGLWCYVDAGSTGVPTDEEIPGFDAEASAHILAVAASFPRATTASRPDGTVYVGCAVVSDRYVALVEALWPDAVWRSRGEREPVSAFVGTRPVALIAPIAHGAGENVVKDLTRPEPDEKLAVRIAELEREVARGKALRDEIERLAELGEGYASARDLRRALRLEGSDKG